MKIAYFSVAKCLNLEEEGSGQSRATSYWKISDFFHVVDIGMLIF